MDEPNTAPPSPASTGEVPSWPVEEPRHTYWVTPAARSVSAFRSASTRSRVAMVALTVIAIVQLGEIFHVLSFDRLVDDYMAGVIGDLELAAYDQLSLNLALAYLAVYIVCGVTFLAWLSRAVDNAPSLGAGVPPRGPRAAIGWWFVPFANLAIPYDIVSDLRRRMALPGESGRRVWLIRAWWAIWLIQAFASYVVVAASGGETLDDIRVWNTATIAADVLTIVAALLAILVIGEFQRLEDARSAFLHSGGPALAAQPNVASGERVEP